jgi:HK97 family phage prohead protease
MKEIRICEIRADAAADAPEALRLEGMPIVYDQPTTINDPAGTFTEIIRAGALDCAELSDTRLLYNHDTSRVPLARTPKTMQLIHDPAGLRMVAELPDTPEAKSVHTAVKRGDLSGMSFAFKVPKGGDKYNAKTKTREIFKIEKVYEVSVVPFPAYSQTSVEARSTIDSESVSARLREQAMITANKILMKEV